MSSGNGGLSILEWEADMLDSSCWSSLNSSTASVPANTVLSKDCRAASGDSWSPAPACNAECLEGWRHAQLFSALAATRMLL